MTAVATNSHDRRLAEAVILGQNSSKTEYTRGLSRMSRELRLIQAGLSELHDREHALVMRRQTLLTTIASRLARAAEHGTDGNIHFSVAARNGGLAAMNELQDVLYDLSIVRGAADVHETSIVRILRAQEEASPSIIGSLLRQIAAWAARQHVAAASRTQSLQRAS